LKKSDIQSNQKVLWLGWPRYFLPTAVGGYFPATKELVLIPETDGISRIEGFSIQKKHDTPRWELKASSLMASTHTDILWAAQKQQDGTLGSTLVRMLDWRHWRTLLG
jgi:hypothetical protein